MPPCITTRVWPSDAIASAEANGSIVSSVPLSRLVGANTKLAASSPSVATMTVVRPRDSRRRDPRGTVSFGSFETVI